MKITKDRLAKKGWSQEEIKRTMKLLEKAKKKKHPRIKALDASIYWIALLLIIFGNFAFSTFLIPVLVTFNNISFYFILLLLAVSFGTIMSVVIKDIEDLEPKHHVAMLSAIPITGLINFFIVVNLANNNLLAEALNTYHNPIIVGVIYLFGFMVPYTYFMFEEKWKK